MPYGNNCFMENKMKHTITIPIKPMAKQRPRMNTKTRHVYTPKVTLEYENKLKEAWDGPQFESPVSVDIVLYKNKVKVTITEEPAEKKSSFLGDIDNYTKAILDGLNGTAYVDDRQIIKLKVNKAQ
jgi:Holliday junction resolvase RusA-like endonuclease